MAYRLAALEYGACTGRPCNITFFFGSPAPTLVFLELCREILVQQVSTECVVLVFLSSFCFNSS